MFRGKQKNKAEDNFMLYIPIKSHDNWIEKQNKIHLVFEHNKPIERFAAWLVKKPNSTDIKLDELGTRVWKLMDGNNSVYEIGQTLLRDFGQDCEPVYERLIMYIHYLYRRGWIRFRQTEEIKDIEAN